MGSHSVFNDYPGVVEGAERRGGEDKEGLVYLCTITTNSSVKTENLKAMCM